MLLGRGHEKVTFYGWALWKVFMLHGDGFKGYLPPRAISAVFGWVFILQAVLVRILGDQ